MTIGGRLCIGVLSILHVSFLIVYSSMSLVFPEISNSADVIGLLSVNLVFHIACIILNFVTQVNK